MLPSLRAKGRQGVLAELAAHLTNLHSGLDGDEVARLLLEREEQGATTISDGVAVSHCKLESLTELVGCFGRSVAGIDFGAVDGRPTHFFFTLVAPVDSAGTHLKALARISRMFRDAGLADRLLAAGTSEDLCNVLRDADRG